MYQFIIVGGGPAGSIVSKYLAKSGKKVLLIQKNFNFKKPCGGGIRMDAFQEFDIDTSLIRNVVNEIILETKKNKIEFDITHIPLAVVDRVKFDEQLRQDSKNAGAIVLEATVNNIIIKEKHVVVRTTNNKHKQEFLGEYLIAADGVMSTIRKKMRNEDVPRGLTNYCDISSVHTTKCHFYFGSDLSHYAYGWRFPYEGGSDIGTAAPYKNKQYINNLLQFLNLKTQEKIKGYYIPQWEKPLFYENKIFYVGDAAGQVLPFTYEGIYYAMKSAKILSTVLIENVDFSEYETRWNTLYLKKFTVLKKLQKLFLINDFMIELMIKVIKQPKVKEKVLLLWMDKYQFNLSLGFLFRVFKQVLKK